MHNNLNVIALKKQKIKWRLNINANQYQPMQLAVLSTLLFGLLTPQAVAEQLKTANMLAAANARGEEIILLGDEELVTDTQLKSATQKSSNANVLTPEKASQPPALASPNKVANQKKMAAAKKAAIAKPATGEYAVISKIEFKQANILDVARALADISGLNVVATENAAKKNVTVFLQNVTVKDALETITKNSGLWYRQDKTSKAYRIMTTEEYQRDLVVYREDTTRVFNLLHPNPVMVATAVQDLYGNRVVMTLGVEAESLGFNGNNSSASNRNQAGNTNNNRNQSANNNRSGVGSMGGGQANMRRTTANGRTNNTNNNVRNNGSNANREQSNLINENLSSEQLDRLDAAMQLDDDGNVLSSNALKSISHAELPIYITINREHNLMIVRTSDVAAVNEIERLVKQMDKPTPQVLLEMKVLELTVGDSYSQLFSFGSISKDGKHALSAPVSDIPSSGLGGGKLIYTFVDSLITARIELLQKDKKINTLSSPILMASNNRPANLFVGEERLLIRGVTVTDPVLNINGVQTTPAKITYETEIRNVGNSLNIVPKINADGTVTLAIMQDTSSVNVGGMQFPPITVGNTTQSFAIDSVNTANIEGIVVAKDGLTVAIGGLIKASKGKDERKVPILGDIPVLGKLFQDVEEFDNKSELILLITPHIIAVPSEGDDVTRDAIEPISEQEW